MGTLHPVGVAPGPVSGIPKQSRPGRKDDVRQNWRDVPGVVNAAVVGSFERDVQEAEGLVAGHRAFRFS